MPDKIENYRKSVEILSLLESTLIFKNSNHQHANIVLTNIARKSKSRICIYDDNLSGDIANLNHSFIETITEFIQNRDGKLNICVKETCKANIFEKQIIELVKKYPNKVVVKKVNTEFQNEILNEFESDLNFAIGDDKMFRLEYGNSKISERTGICSFNNTEYPSKILKIFDKHFDHLESYNV